MPRAEKAALWQGGVCLLTLLLPFGEGGATPGALLLTHSLILFGALALSLAGRSLLRPPLLPRELARAFPVLLGALLLASWQTPYPYASFLRLWDLGMVTVTFVLARGACWENGGLSILADCMLASAVLQALVVIGGSLTTGVPAAIARMGLLNSNHEAAYLNLGVLVSVPALFREERGGRWMRSGGILVCLAAFPLLASRGALLGLGSAALILAASGWRNASVRGRRALAAVFILTVTFALLSISRRFGGAGDPFPYERARIWAADVRCAAGHPFLGVGPGIFRHVAHRFNFPLEGTVRFGRNFETPHSDYLGLLVETGLVGLGAGLFLGARVLLMIQGGGPGSRIFRTGVLAGLTALAVQGLVEDISLRPALILSAALLAAAASSRSENSPPGMGWMQARASRALFLSVPLVLAWIAGVLNPYLAFREDQAMRHARNLPEMETHFDAAVRFNPFQSDTWRFPASAFQASSPPNKLTLDLYARFRRELDEGISVDRTSADLLVTRARLETMAFRDLFHDSSSVNRALSSYREGVMRVPHDPRPRIEMAGLLRDLGRRREALEQVERGLAEEPVFLSAHLLRACILLEDGDQEGAAKEWRRVLDLDRQLVSYRPDSSYAMDITRDYPPYRRFLQEKLKAN